MKMRVIIMTGIPGSGKSRWVLDARWRGTGEHWLVCSTDDYFMRWSIDGERTYAFDPSKLGEAHGQCLLKYEEALRLRSCDVLVVDNTNTTTEEIAPYMALALAHGARVEVVHVRCPPEVAAARNTHGVPLRACEVMDRRLRDLRLPPFWTCVQGQVGSADAGGEP